MAKILIVTNKDEIQLVLKIIQDKLNCKVSDYPSLMLFMAKIEFSEQAPFLSINTWRRLFGLIKNDHSPTIATLNIIGQYAGFASWFDFVYSNSRETERALSHIVGNYAAGNFNQLDVAGIFKETGPSAHFYRLMQHVLTISFTRRNTDFIAQLYSNEEYFPFDLKNKDAVYEEFNLHQLAGIYCIQLHNTGFYNVLKQSPVGLKKVLELCVNYGEAANLYIDLLRFAVKENVFDSNDLFPSSVLAYHAFLTKNRKELKAHADKFDNYQPQENTLLLCGRIRVCQWYTKFENSDINEAQILEHGNAMTAEPTDFPLEEIQYIFMLLTKLKLLIYANLNWNCKVRSVELNYKINIESIEVSVNVMMLTLVQSNSKLLNAFEWLINKNSQDFAIIEQPNRFYANLVEIIKEKCKNIVMWNEISKCIALGH